MCVIIHKPAGARIAPGLIAAAASLNRDGWGLMGFDARGALIVERHERVDLRQVLAAEERHADAEYALHLRLSTRGATGTPNVHPLPITDDAWLMHNGTLCRLDVTDIRHSDSTHLAGEVLRPLLLRDGGLLDQPAFRRLLELALGADNRAVLLHRPTRRLHILNREAGAEVDGLWCSNTRWIDQRIHTLTDPPQAQERSPATETLHFI